MLIVHTFIHIQSHICLCYKILQFDFPDTSIRQTTRAHVQHVFGNDPWKDILLDSRIIFWEKHVMKYVKYLLTWHSYNPYTVERIILDLSSCMNKSVHVCH